MDNKAQEIYSKEGFIEKYYSYLKHTNSSKLAYEYVEKLHKRVFGQRKYKNFKSFERQKQRYLSKPKS